MQDPFLKNLDLSTIADERARECIARLLNLVETSVAEGHQLRAENQRLRDRQKGQQGKPNIPPIGPPQPALRRTQRKNGMSPKNRHKGSKKDQIHIDRQEKLEVTPRLCPQMRSSKGTKE